MKPDDLVLIDCLTRHARLDMDMTAVGTAPTTRTIRPGTTPEAEKRRSHDDASLDAT